MAFDIIPEGKEPSFLCDCGGNIKKRNGKLECDSLDYDSCDLRWNCDDCNLISNLMKNWTPLPESPNENQR
jgi:citrate lyase alpha subunit